MATQPQLPSRFPVGTHYIVEGKPRKAVRGERYDLMMPAERVHKPADLACKGRQPC
jgi:hypothetical protein